MHLLTKSHGAIQSLKPNYAFKPIAEQALRPNQTIVPQRLNAALDFLRMFAYGMPGHIAGRKSAAPARAARSGVAVCGLCVPHAVGGRLVCIRPNPHI